MNSGTVGGGTRRFVPRSPLSAWSVWTTGPRGWLTLIVICLTVYLPGLTSIAPIDRDESRFAQASRQMFESVALPKELRNPAMHSGGLAVPMVQDRPRLNKPPLVYWLQAASAAVFTGGDPLKDAIWMYRVPGVLCAIASVLITWRLGRRMFDPRAAWLGAVILGVCPLVVVDAHMARADQLLLLTVVGGQYWLWRLWKERKAISTQRHRGTEKRHWGDEEEENEGDSEKQSSLAFDQLILRQSSRSDLSSLRLCVSVVCFWICIGASVLAKGPIGPMVIGLTALMIAAVHGREGLRWLWSLRPLTGVVVVPAMCVPWLWMVGEHVGWQKYYDTIFTETITRSLEPKEGHWGPPGYHLVLMVALLWPGSMLTGVGVGRAMRIGWPRVVAKGQAASRWWKRRGGRDAELFCIAWIMPAWIAFELVSTKLPHYTMPMYPALALLSGRAVMSATKLLKNDKVARFGVMACVWTGLALGALAVPMSFYLVHWAYTFAAAAGVSVTLIAAYLGIQAVKSALRSRWITAQLYILAEWATIVTLLFSSVLPDTMPGATTGEVEKLMQTNVPNWQQRPVATTYHEDSLIFATRGRAQRIETRDITSWVRAFPDGVLIARMSEVGGDQFNIVDANRLEPRVRLVHEVPTSQFLPSSPDKDPLVVVASEPTRR